MPLRLAKKSRSAREDNVLTKSHIVASSALDLDAQPSLAHSRAMVSASTSSPSRKMLGAPSLHVW